MCILVHYIVDINARSRLLSRVIDNVSKFNCLSSKFQPLHNHKTYQHLPDLDNRLYSVFPVFDNSQHNNKDDEHNRDTGIGQNIE